MGEDADDLRRRRERAAKLRPNIRRRTQDAPSGEATEEPPASPREAIERRMRELDRDKKR
jgi:hypothetical protein